MFLFLYYILSVKVFLLSFFCHPCPIPIKPYNRHKPRNKQLRVMPHYRRWFFVTQWSTKQNAGEDHRPRSAAVAVNHR